jgi:hypothetical protein
MEEKLSLLADLIKLAKSDKEFREDEKQFIFAIAQQLGVSPEDYIRLFKENIEFKPPKLEFDRIVHFQRLILVMNVDEGVDDLELDFVKDLGLKMGLNPLAILSVLDEMHKHPNNMIPPNILISIFKTYHN